MLNASSVLLAEEDGVRDPGELPSSDSGGIGGLQVSDETSEYDGPNGLGGSVTSSELVESSILGGLCGLGGLGGSSLLAG